MKSFILFLLIALPCFARLGENEAQLKARFGDPVMRDKSLFAAQGRTYELGARLYFKQGDWQVICELVDGRCARIGYSKVGDWTEEHFQTVLNANTQGLKWEELPTGSKKSVRKWKRSDGGVANWTIGKMDIVVPAYERAKAVIEAKAKAEARKPAKI